MKTFYFFHVSFWASSKLILTFTKWGGVTRETTSARGLHFSSFIAFSMNVLKTKLIFGIAWHFLTKIEHSSGVWGNLSMENLLKFLTGGHLVYLRPCLLTVHLVTALKERIKTKGRTEIGQIIKAKVTRNARFEPLCFGYITIFYLPLPIEGQP